MGTGYKHGAGGTRLNFKVIGNPQPSTPKENTIWLDTDVPITSHVFSATQPTGAEGMVWIATGTSSAAAFNALKKNDLEVYPLYAMQYVSGAWVVVPAKTWQAGAWVEWITFLYNQGYEVNDITGTWIARGGKFGESTTAVAPTVVKNADSMRIYQTSEGGGYVAPVNTIDLTGYSKLKADVTVTKGPYSNWTRFAVYKTVGKLDSTTAELWMPVGARREFSMDISALSGTHTVAFMLYATSSSTNDITVHKVWLER